MRRLLVAIAALALLFVAAPAARAADLLVFAAASLKNALAEVDAGWAQTAAGKAAGVKTAFAGSSALARQIEAGAPADLFISADLDWMDYLEKKALVKVATRGNLLGNAIVLVAPADTKGDVKIAALPKLLGKDGKLAMADTSAVPAGKYSKAALEHLKLWDAVQGRIAQAENVRAALALVARGEAPYGIVYATDAAAEPQVRIADTFPADSHPPIIYPAAVLAGSTNPAAAAYLAYLHGPAAAAIFARHGFTVLGAPARTN
jgi:molybdate transport system substrate-binding protein